MKAVTSATRRSYFYYLSERGSLFHVFDVKGLLTGRSLPAGPTFLSDARFLDFFFRRVECNHVGHIRHIATTVSAGARNTAKASSGDSTATESTVGSSLSSSTLAELHTPEFLFSPLCSLEDGSCLSPFQMLLHFPYVSLCGSELNFIKAQDGVPVVFTAIHIATETLSAAVADHRASQQLHHHTATLRFAGNLEQRFDPSAIVVADDGKMFHPVTGLRSVATHKIMPERNTTAATSTPREVTDLTSLIAPLSSVDLTMNAALRRHLVSLASKATPTAAAMTLPHPTSEEDVRRLLTHVEWPPRGLLGASVGIQLGMEYITEDDDNIENGYSGGGGDEGHFTMMWNGERLSLPRWN